MPTVLPPYKYPVTSVPQIPARRICGRTRGNRRAERQEPGADRRGGAADAADDGVLPDDAAPERSETSAGGQRRTDDGTHRGDVHLFVGVHAEDDLVLVITGRVRDDGGGHTAP